VKVGSSTERVSVKVGPSGASVGSAGTSLVVAVVLGVSFRVAGEVVGVDVVSGPGVVGAVGVVEVGGPTGVASSPQPSAARPTLVP
jgi:hypothetical protein